MVYVTSDLHGCSPEVLQLLLDQAGFSETDDLFVLGDVIDRGERGAELLLWLTQQPNVSLILGNHEAMLLSCAFLFQPVTEESAELLTMENLSLMQTWMENGGGPTLKGMKRLLKQSPDLLEGILEYLQEAPLYEQIRVNGKHYVLVHSGLEQFDPGKDLEDYSPENLLWARPGLETRYYDDRTVIFGHTPTQLLESSGAGKMLRRDSWICIDTGAALGGSPMLLRLGDEVPFYVSRS